MVSGSKEPRWPDERVSSDLNGCSFGFPLAAKLIAIAIVAET